MSKSSPNTPHGIVLLVASDVQDKTLREETIPLDDYYDKLHPMIDSDDFRKRGRIRRIHGRIFNYDGNLDQEFTNEYNDSGALSRSRVVHADGTVLEN